MPRVTIKEAFDAGDYDKAMQIVDDAYLEDPEASDPAFYSASMFLRTDHPGVAKDLLTALVQKHPDKWQAWMNLAVAWNELRCEEQALECIYKALALNPNNAEVIGNISTIYCTNGKWDDCIKWGKRRLDHGPNLQAEVNMGFAYLGNGELGKGWDQYAKGAGHMRWRALPDLGLPLLEEGAQARVIIVAEQGIGDQIAFMSALKDGLDAGMIVDAITCYPKMERLFQDTFPDIPVHPYQFRPDRDWLVDYPYATHIMPMSWLMAYWRRKKENFSGEPYLKVNPDKQLQWRALLDNLSPNPKVGVAWTGGARGSHSWMYKSVDLEYMLPVLQTEGVDFVCMEYKNRGKQMAEFKEEHGITIHEWPWGTRTSDYSDTAAMVSCLDALVTIPTSVNHLAGALGIPAYCLVPERAHFHYQLGMPYYNSVHLYQRDKLDEVVQVVRSLRRREAA